MEELYARPTFFPARPLEAAACPLFSAIHWNCGVICFLAGFLLARAEAFPDM